LIRGILVAHAVPLQGLVEAACSGACPPIAMASGTAEAAISPRAARGYAGDGERSYTKACAKGSADDTAKDVGMLLVREFATSRVVIVPLNCGISER
jgi:hypothetical protein